jgi:hypothetical protein
MPYSELATCYKVYKQQVEEKKKDKSYNLKKLASIDLDVETFYKKFLDQVIKTDSTQAFRCVSEASWYKNGCPYYNIHPSFVSKLCKCDLSKIPSSLFKMPHGLHSIHIRFKELHPELVYSNIDSKDLYGTSILVCEMSESQSKKRVISVSLDLMSNSEEIGKGFDIKKYKLEEDNDCRSLFVFNIMLAENETLNDGINNAIDKNILNRNVSQSIVNSFKKLSKNVLSLCSTIGFLSDNPTICEPDILAADRHLIEKSNPQELEALHQKAKNKRKYGWNIGTDRMFVGPQPFQLANKSQAAEGKEREYAHIRAGHPHAVRYGKGKELVKIMWFVPLTVRPDLPFKIEQQTQPTL